ncbi:MAG: F0F1 ATP synthase subunit epsilon [bacterium]|nr:F0F1 ATP synthase subunit epsilon [bacterium]
MFKLSIVTPERVYCETEVESLVVPGTDGYLGVLSHHAPLITALKPGRIEYRDAESKVHTLAVSGGFIEISDNQATLLADTIESGDEIDLERAKAARDRAQERMAKRNSSDISIDRAAAALSRALNRMKVYGDTH